MAKKKAASKSPTRRKQPRKPTLRQQLAEAQKDIRILEHRVKSLTEKHETIRKIHDIYRNAVEHNLKQLGVNPNQIAPKDSANALREAINDRIADKVADQRRETDAAKDQVELLRIIIIDGLQS